MNIKRKLRRGFDQAAPDVWGRVQGKLPQQKKPAPQAFSWSAEKKSPLWEAVTTAAALVVAVAVVGGGLWMYLTYGPLRPSNPDPGLSAIPTDPTLPSTEPTLPTTEPTQPPTESSTEPSTEPTLPDDVYVSKEEAITIAAEYFRITDYQAACQLDNLYLDQVPLYYYHVTLDTGEYICEAKIRGDVPVVWRAYCTQKEGTAYPGGFALPSTDLSDEEFMNQYTILKPEGGSIFTKGMKYIAVTVHPTEQTVSTINGIRISSANGKPIFQYKGSIYCWESDTVFTEIGTFEVDKSGRLRYELVDGDYEIAIDFECHHLCVGYATQGASDKGHYDYDKFSRSSLWVDISNYDSAKVTCYEITENGRVEVAPYGVWFKNW